MHFPEEIYSIQNLRNLREEISEEMKNAKDSLKEKIISNLNAFHGVLRRANNFMNNCFAQGSARNTLIEMIRSIVQEKGQEIKEKLNLAFTNRDLETNFGSMSQEAFISYVFSRLESYILKREENQGVSDKCIAKFDVQKMILEISDDKRGTKQYQMNLKFQPKLFIDLSILKPLFFPIDIEKFGFYRYSLFFELVCENILIMNYGKVNSLICVTNLDHLSNECFYIKYKHQNIRQHSEYFAKRIDDFLFRLEDLQTFYFKYEERKMQCISILFYIFPDLGIFFEPKKYQHHNHYYYIKWLEK